jgi:thiamine pyrophosphate-dependent acetolactate synthase large subunit-like protein
MIEGTRVIELIGKHRTDEVVVTTMSSARAWPTVSKEPELDLPLVGCMGKASSLALGVALARPDRRVIVLDGDGSLLMNLGSLVTVAGMAPRNLVHFVLEGRTYDTSGGQPTPGEGRGDLAGIAKAAGYRTAVTIDDEAALEAALPDLLRGEGPAFACIRVNSMWASGAMPTGGLKRAWPAVARKLAGAGAGG